LDIAEAGNIIKIALGEDLGEGAIKSIGKLSMMFGNADKMGLKEAMLATGSAINEVAQNSSAAEPYLVEFTNRLAGVGNQAKMSISQIIGLGSVLDQNAQQVEMSSTALSGLIMKLYKEPAKFAKIAGLEVKSFTELLRKDANGALLTLLETLSKKGGMADLAPVFDEMKLDGARAASVLSVLAGNIEQIRKEQETATKAFNEGTSAVNEYGVKNNTLQAQIDKAKNKFQELVYELGQRLAPHMSIFISTGGSMVKIISAITNFLINYGRQILAVAATIAAYTVAVKAQNALLVINNTLSEISRVNKMREAILTRQNAAAQLIFNDTVQKRNFLVKASAVITSLFSAATSLLTGNTKKAAAAMQTLNAITKLNPVGLAVAAVTALAAGIFLLTRRTSEYIDKAKALTGITNEANKSIYREKTELELLFSVAKNETVSKEERLKAIKKLNEIAPEYLGNISLENINTQAAATAVKAYTDELIKNAKAKAVADKITELEGKRLDNLNKIAKLEEKMIKGVPMQISAL
jgi:TP901 family phage tail tape measure protein